MDCTHGIWTFLLSKVCKTHCDTWQRRYRMFTYYLHMYLILTLWHQRSVLVHKMGPHSLFCFGALATKNITSFFQCIFLCQTSNYTIKILTIRCKKLEIYNLEFFVSFLEWRHCLRWSSFAFSRSFGNHEGTYWVYHERPKATSDKFNISQVITLTSSDIFQYFNPINSNSNKLIFYWEICTMYCIYNNSFYKYNIYLVSE